MSLIFGLQLLIAAQSAAQLSPFCRGVAVETPEGPRNFVGIYVEGDDQALLRFKAAADALHFAPSGPAVGTLGRVRVTVSFRTASSNPSESTNPAQAMDFLHRAERGEFGRLVVRSLMVDIDTLPADRC